MRIIGFFSRFLAFSFVFVLFQNENDTNAETLKNAIEKAYKVSETIEIKRNQADFGKINRDTAILNFIPTLTMNYQYNYKQVKNSQSYSDPSMVMMMQQQNGEKKTFEGSHMASISMRSSLSFWKTLPGVYVAWKGMTAKEYEYNDFLENFGLLFIQKYMDVIYNEKSLEVYKQMSETLEKKVKKVQVMKQYGSAKNDKVVLAEAQYYKNKADEIQTKSNLDKTKMDYKIMTGEDPIDLTIPDVSNAKLPAKNKDDFVALVLAQNSKLKQTRDEMISQKNYMIIQSFDMLPELYSELSYAYYKIPNMMTYNGAYMGIGVSWTINGSNNRFANFRKEYKTYRIANLNYSLTLKQIEQDAGYAWEQYFAMLELVKATEKALKASTDSLKEVKVSVATGTATFIDEMDVENQYLEANLNYLNAQKALILSYYKMISMTGVGKLPVM